MGHFEVPLVYKADSIQIGSFWMKSSKSEFSWIFIFQSAFKSDYDESKRMKKSSYKIESSFCSEKTMRASIRADVNNVTQFREKWTVTDRRAETRKVNFIDIGP